MAIYFFVVVVGILLICFGLWEHTALVKDWVKILEPVVILFVYSFVTVLGGGCLSHALRKITKKYHDSELE